MLTWFNEFAEEVDPKSAVYHAYDPTISTDKTLDDRI